MDPFTIGMMGISALGSIFGASGQAEAGEAKLQEYLAKARASREEGELTLLQAQMYGINVETAQSNVKILSMQAEASEGTERIVYAKANLQKGRISEQGRVTLEAQRSTFTGRNVDPTFGSPLMAQAVTAGRIAADLDITDAGAAIEAADARTRSANMVGQVAGAQGQVVSQIGQQFMSLKRAQSLFSRSEDEEAAGYAARKGAQTSAVSSLLSGAGKLWSMGGSSLFGGSSPVSSGGLGLGSGSSSMSTGRLY